MIGDAIPHPPSDPQNKDKLHWRAECAKLSNQLVRTVFNFTLCSFTILTISYNTLSQVQKIFFVVCEKICCRPQTKLREGNVFTSVCLSTRRSAFHNAME